MFMRSLKRFLLTILIGIAATVLGVLYHRSLVPTLKHFAPKFAGSSTGTSTSTTTTATANTPGMAPVIVVGSGLAGLSAAHEALRAGAARVHLLDRAPKPGGNSIKASSGINGAGTRFQRAAGVERDDSFYDDTVRSAGARFRDTAAGAGAGAGVVDRAALVALLTTRSAAAVDWLADDIGVDLGVVAPLGGHSVARTHRGGGKVPPGAAIVAALLKALGEEGEGRFELETAAEVTELLLGRGEGGVVVEGVRYVRGGVARELAGAVVFAAGGFAGDADGLLARHRPDLAGLPSTNEARPGPHGILAAAGAALVDMDSVQVHPSGFVDAGEPGARYKFLAAEVMRGEGGILLSDAGGRFVDEMQTREHVSKAIMALPAARDTGATRQWDITLLLDPGACDAVAGHLGFYLFKGLMEKKKVGELSPAQIRAVDGYAEAVSKGSDAAFGRRAFGRWRLPAGEGNRDEEVCIGRVTPIVHFTMGGAAINEKAQVLRGDKTAIGGLWAAGEITGGVHGDNRLGGSSLLECVVFGRIAGQEAAKMVA